MTGACALMSEQAAGKASSVEVEVWYPRPVVMESSNGQRRVSGRGGVRSLGLRLGHSSLRFVCPCLSITWNFTGEGMHQPRGSGR